MPLFRLNFKWGMMLLNKLERGSRARKPAMLRVLMGETCHYSTAKRYNFYYRNSLYRCPSPSPRSHGISQGY
jgi:hypothetical protein